MKKIILFAIPLLLLVITSCSSVNVLSDYDKEVSFNEYKTYAFYKTGIDKAQISDLDKKRILKAIETEMAAKGFQKSNSPDILISIFTKEKEQVNVYRNTGFYGGFYGGFYPYYWGRPGFNNGNQITTNTQGSLYIDLIDAKKKELVWQGKGVGTLNETKSIEKKEQRIKEFVSKILTQYPPQLAAN